MLNSGNKGSLNRIKELAINTCDASLWCNSIVVGLQINFIEFFLVFFQRFISDKSATYQLCYCSLHIFLYGGL